MAPQPPSDSYRAYFEQSPIAVFVVDETGSYVDVNPRAAELTGYSRDELLDMSVSTLAYQTFTDELPPSFRTLKESDRSETELQIEHADGHPITIHLDAVSVSEDRFVAYVRDISDRKEREQQLRELTERLDLAIEGANLGIWDWDMQTGEVTRNEEWAQMLGYEPGEIPDRFEEWEDLVHPDDRHPHDEALEQHIEGTEPLYRCEYRLRTKDAEWKWARNIGKVVEWENGDPKRAVGVHEDIDQQKRAEQALETAKDRLRQIIDLVPDLLFVKNRNGEYLLANEAVAEAFGRPVEEILGQSDYDLLHSDQDPEDFRPDDIDVIESGQPKTIEEEDLLTASGEHRIYNTVKIPYEPAGSEDRAVLGYARDITDLKEYERTLEAQRDSLEVLNQTVRHDIRNDLQLVVAYAELLEDHVEEAGDTHLEQVQNAAKNAVRITKTARTVAEVVLQADTDLTPINLRATLEDEIETVRSNHEAAIIQATESIPECSVLADDLLNSVFRNLLQNAVMHNDTEVPTVTVTATEQDGQAIIEIADDGPGVSDEKTDEIFEKGVHGLESEGTGLGLYIVETLVDRYGGAVTVADNDPRGAVFTVRLPLAE